MKISKLPAIRAPKIRLPKLATRDVTLRVPVLPRIPFRIRIERR